MTVRFCEFTGDDKKDFDEIGKSERLCEYAGFSHCTLYKKQLHSNSEGWRLCLDECTTPKQIKTK